MNSKEKDVQGCPVIWEALFLLALMNAAQLGVEPNTPLGQAYLIPYKNKGALECQYTNHSGHKITT